MATYYARPLPVDAHMWGGGAPTPQWLLDAMTAQVVRALRSPPRVAIVTPTGILQGVEGDYIVYGGAGLSLVKAADFAALYTTGPEEIKSPAPEIAPPSAADIILAKVEEISASVVELRKATEYATAMVTEDIRQREADKEAEKIRRDMPDSTPIVSTESGPARA